MATSLSLENDSSLAQGYLKVNGSTAATLTTSGITGNLVGNVTGSLTQGGSLTLGTVQTASGTAVNFTGIPSWAKRITVIFNRLSLNGTSNFLIQIGSGSVASSGYLSASSTLQSTGNIILTSTSGFSVRNAASAPSTSSGIITIVLSHGTTYVSSHSLGDLSESSIISGGGASPSLSGTLDRIRITTVNGTDTFDDGTINISYEG
jgi:hypothetical protein